MESGVVLVLAAIVVATGVVAMFELSIDALADVTDVMVQINTEAPSLSPLEVEQQLTFKVEQAMGGLPNVKLVRSLSFTRCSLILHPNNIVSILYIL